MTVSINTLFLSRILSAILIREFFILFFILVTNCMSLRKRFLKSACPIYPLPAQSFPLILSRNFPCFNDFRPSTHIGIDMKLKKIPLPLILNYIFKSEGPSHRTFSTLGKTFKSLVNQNLLAATDTQKSRVYKTNPGTYTQQHLFNKDNQRQQDFLFLIPRNDY